MRLLLIIFFLLFNNWSLSKNLLIEGNNRLSYEDIKSLTSIDLSKDNYVIGDINSIILDLYNSDLISDVKLSEDDKNYIITIIENSIIENIFINGNVFLKDDIFFDLIQSKKDKYLNKKYLNKDIQLIRNLYLSEGFNNISTTVSTEKYSKNKINLIFNISEGKRVEINKINLKGNKTFSNKFLLSKLYSEEIKFFNIFSNGSNVSSSIFINDINILENYYKNKGFNNVKITYQITEFNKDRYELNFYIDENERITIDKIEYDFESIENDELILIKKKFEKEIKNNSYFFDGPIINDLINQFNKYFLSNNILINIKYDLVQYENEIILKFYETNEDFYTINKININGNSITKDSVIRSKLNFEPNDYFIETFVSNDLENLSSFPYINSVKYDYININKNTDIDIYIDENKKTGNLLAAGTVSGDRGLGVSFGANDKNLFGSGNSLKSSFSFDEESLLFDLSYIQYPLSNPNFFNRYSITNEELDFTPSFGYKLKEQSIGYGITYKQTEDLSLSAGYKFSKINGHSAKYNDSIVLDNIGNFYDSSLSFSLLQDTTNDFFFPSDGYKTSLSLIVSPNNISDNSYVSSSFQGTFFNEFKESNNYLFLDSNLSISESLDGERLKSINTFSLGGLNFKGFDYRGIGQKNSNGIYYGGKKMFNASIGYGSSFIFDEKDNIYFKLFYTVGSLWDNDYIDDPFKLRSSIGSSIDFKTAVGPISLFYAIPINKSHQDKERNFNFAIGTSF